jgi:diacylglycerol kinase family enzyme
VAPEAPALVLANAAAGSAAEADVRTAVDALREQGDVDVVVPEGPEHLRSVLSTAAGRDVVVLGGDGSVHACLAALDDLGLLDEVGPIGIVPLGTGNDLARALELPFDPVEAAQVALHGKVLAADLLRADDGGIVVNAVHAGLGAQATAHAEEVKGLLGTIGYAVGAVRAGATSSGWHLDGGERALMVTAAVGPSIGGGTRIAPRARPDDRRVTVVLATATGWLARAGYALALRGGTHRQRRDVAIVHGREVTVEAVEPQDAFLVNADGDVDETRRTRARWTLEPSAWRCRVPTS